MTGPARLLCQGEGSQRVCDLRRVLDLEVRTLAGFTYRIAEQDSDGWALSPLFGTGVRLTRQPMPHDGWLYTLEVRQ